MKTGAVIFDLDHTLYNFMDCHEMAEKVVWQYANRRFGLGWDEFEELVAKAMKDTEEKIGTNNASIHSRTLRFQTLLESLGAPAVRYAHPMGMLYWNTFYEYMEPLEEVESMLVQLRKKGIRTLVATDMTCEVQFEKLHILGINHHIDFLVTSEEAGEEKPGKRLLDLCVKKAGVPKEECIFVGDHPKKDVLGPISYGMKGVWCRAFGAERFMKAYDISITKEEEEAIIYRIEDYRDCFDKEGRLTNIGGIEI